MKSELRLVPVSTDPNRGPDAQHEIFAPVATFELRGIECGVQAGIHGRGCRSPADEPLHRRVPVGRHAGLATIVAEERKVGLGLTLAHQTLVQLEHDDPALLAAVLGNTASAVVTRVSVQDADVLARRLSPPVRLADLLSLPDFQAWARAPAGDGAAVRPIALAASTAADDRCRPAQLVSSSRRRHARPRPEVEADLRGRYAPAAEETLPRMATTGARYIVRP